ncbi:phospholipase [Microbacterium sp.]|uniref:aggregation-promoting factor C-terminal-like domain-containing protein n=1 Tax=Microbacterium sp. TaxID=51671 RepID=UPI0026329274|nr:phospholipase [Microbacterium sp.]MCV0333095.1 phospholipase [Microbacterium sp.]MCV0375540.1 phospholipase [Microbacterium sp.]MCV0389105.1 phospholipase [Microbacterium sp.]MCV0417633.1 phospholipase [Microbacterium sp.]MCV0420944.1 phospholipase [Microbacterium sp.]
MLQKTRALRRASAAASARSAAHRPMTLLGLASATLVGITLSVGLASAPAVGAINPAVAVTAPALAGAEPLAQITEDAAATLAKAKDAATAASTLGSEVVASGLDVGAVTSVDTTDLQKDIDKLDDIDVTPVLLVGVLADEVEEETANVVSDTDELRSALTAAQQKQAEEEAARVAAEQAAAQAAAEQQAAAALAAANTPEGAKAAAQQIMSSTYGWGGDQFSCLNSLWNKESRWNYQAYNPSGATGIPQALPGSKMSSAGSDWQTNAATQVAWGLGYISSVYGTPCSAWSHSQAMNWY